MDWKTLILSWRARQEEDQAALIAGDKDSREIAELSRRVGERSGLLKLGDKLLSLEQELNEVEGLLAEGNDSDLQQLAKEDEQRIRLEISGLSQELLTVTNPANTDDNRNAVLEIRAGTGGEEAALFAGDLFQVYMKFIALKGWRSEVLEYSGTDLAGCSKSTIAITGDRVYGEMKFESGVHRVQRVPRTESSGRIHTSAASVMVLPEAEKTDIQIEDKDLRIDRYRSQGAGGQHVNRTDSAVRITHLPTGIVAQCQDNKSQHRNRDQAMRVLRSRVYDYFRTKEADERLKQKRSLVKSGDRSQRVRTYNYSQNRITDHRAGYTVRQLTRNFESADISCIIEALKNVERENHIQSIEHNIADDIHDRSDNKPAK